MTEKNTMIRKLSGKIALVTGASKGIGASIARHLAAEGASVVVNYAISQSGAGKVVAEITAAGGAAVTVQGDFSQSGDITRAFAEIKQKYGKLDCLVNCAGVYAFGPVSEVTEEEFHRQFNLNVLGLLLATKEALPLFDSEGGSIINIGSAASKMPPGLSSIYAGTKGAVDSITISLSKELGTRKIRVNSLNPGFVETEGTTAGGYLGSDFHAFFLSTTPLGRIGTPDDIGRIAAFLASEDAYWINGQQIIAGGGQTS